MHDNRRLSNFIGRRSVVLLQDLLVLDRTQQSTPMLTLKTYSVVMLIASYGALGLADITYLVPLLRACCCPLKFMTTIHHRHILGDF